MRSNWDCTLVRRSGATMRFHVIETAWANLKLEEPMTMKWRWPARTTSNRQKLRWMSDRRWSLANSNLTTYVQPEMAEKSPRMSGFLEVSEIQCGQLLDKPAWIYVCWTLTSMTYPSSSSTRKLFIEHRILSTRNHKTDLTNPDFAASQGVRIIIWREALLNHIF